MLWLERVHDRDEFEEWLSSEPDQVRQLTAEEADQYEVFGLRRPA